MPKRNQGPTRGRKNSSSRSSSSGKPFKSRGESPSRDSRGKDSRKSFGKRSEGDSGSSRPYSSRSGSASGKPFKRRDDDSTSRPRDSDKREGGFGKRTGGRSGASSSYSSRSSSGKPYKKSFGDDAGKRAPGKYSSSDKPYGKRSEGRSDSGSFDASKSKEPRGNGRFKKFNTIEKETPFNKKREEGRTGPPRSRSSEDSSEKRPYSSNRKRDFDKGDEGKSGGKLSKRTFSADNERPRRNASFSKRNDNNSKRTESSGEERKGFSDKRKSDFSPRPRKSSAVPYSADAPVQTEKIRLNRFIANSGVCSRREADELITMGLISVNGKTITELGYKVNPGDEVRHESKVLKAEKPVYILMNKPKGFLTTTNDPQERNTVMHILGNAVKERVYPVGRLDRNTTGLLLLTNDGDLADKLMHPSYNVKKIYKVELDRPLTKADFQRLQEGIQLEEGKAVVDDVAIISEDGKTVGVELHIGWNRVVRRIFEAMEYEVVKLDRSVYAGLDKKDLPRGHFRFLKKEEIVHLKHFK